MLPRLQLLEFEDQPWWPRSLRDAMTDYLQALITWFDPYRPAIPLLVAALARTGETRVVDLGSGGGGPWARLEPRLAALGTRLDAVILTDRFPNTAAFAYVTRGTGGRVIGHTAPVDAARVPPALTGFRTMFTALHHFPPAQARAIIGDAVGHRRGIAVFEMTRRSLSAMAGMIVLAALVPLVTPWIRPLRWSRLFWTYLVPAVPLAFLCDAVVSCLRTYTPDELRALVTPFGNGSYHWEAGCIATPFSAAPVTFLIGTPI